MCAIVQQRRGSGVYTCVHADDGSECVMGRERRRRMGTREGGLCARTREDVDSARAHPGRPCAVERERERERANEKVYVCVCMCVWVCVCVWVSKGLLPLTV